MTKRKVLLKKFFVWTVWTVYKSRGFLGIVICTCSNKQMSNNHTCVVDAHGLKSCSGFLMALDVLFKIAILGRGSMELWKISRRYTVFVFYCILINKLFFSILLRGFPGWPDGYFSGHFWQKWLFSKVNFYKKLLLAIQDFVAIFQHTFLQKSFKAIWLFSGYFWPFLSIFSHFSSN